MHVSRAVKVAGQAGRRSKGGAAAAGALYRCGEGTGVLVGHGDTRFFRTQARLLGGKGVRWGERWMVVMVVVLVRVGDGWEEGLGIWWLGGTEWALVQSGGGSGGGGSGNVWWWMGG